METRRPDGSSRKAIDLFERALKVNSRDAGVLQPYALFVAELGDLEAARELYVFSTFIGTSVTGPLVVSTALTQTLAIFFIFQTSSWYRSEQAACSCLAGVGRFRNAKW